MKRPMRTYEYTFAGETRRANSNREGIANIGVGVFEYEDGHIEWFGTLTIQADPIKAASAARSSNKYASRYTVATSWREVTA